MSTTYRMTISDELASLIDERRGVLSVQEYTLLALVDKVNGSQVEHELRRQLDALRTLLGGRSVEQLVEQRVELPSGLFGGSSTIVVPTPSDERLTW